MKDRISERVEFINLNNSNEPTLFDLSKTGVCCYYSKKKEKGEIVSVKINALILKASVVYCQDRADGFRLGMQFTNVAADQQAALGDCVDKFSRGVPLLCSVFE